MFFLALLLAAKTAAQSTLTTVCVADQCLQGQSNISIGATLTTSRDSIILLPGQYTSSSSPPQLSNVFSSTGATLSSPQGFSPPSGAVSLPLNIGLLPGAQSYPQAPFSGRSLFVPISNTTNATVTPSDLQSGSFLLSPNTWAVIETTSGSTKSRVVVWETVPFLSQLPGSLRGSSLSLSDMQPSICSPPCASPGRCSPAGTCSCPKGFTGATCETCAKGFFGPNCSPCPQGCLTCDEGLTGSGQCLSPASAASAPSTCNCLNGVCTASGQCKCNPGWTSTNGTACSTCAPGFFQTPKGDCQLCQLGCTQCASGTGICIQCGTGFTPDANDRTKCIAPLTSGSDGICPDGSFGTGAAAPCAVCSPSCKTCRGPLPTDCIFCGAGQFTLAGQCVDVDANGVCAGSTLVANNLKKSCDACPAKCTACQIPSFNVAKNFDQVVCTKCLPGSVLSGGKCIDQCPVGTTISPLDGLTCIPCDTTCKTCAGDSKFCLTCAAPTQLAFGGQCTSTCPSNTFASNGACISCHRDCSTCSGPGFNQCTGCPASRPVPQFAGGAGRCLPTCSKAEFFDTSSSSCKACDSTCSSCSTGGPQGCLACSNPNQVLRAGSCVAAGCSAIPGLGVCLSELVISPGAPSPPPAVDVPPPSTTVVRLEWWQFLLIALGGVAIIAFILICWRRRARKNRAKRTEEFSRKIEQKGIFRRTLEAWFGVKNKNKPEDIERLRDGAGSYRSAYTRSNYSYHGDRSQYGPSVEMQNASARRPSIDGRSEGEDRRSHSPTASIASSPSKYSQGSRLPEPRQPIRDRLPSRFSGTTNRTSLSLLSRASSPPLTDTRNYNLTKLGRQGELNYHMSPLSSNGSKREHNPFRTQL